MTATSTAEKYLELFQDDRPGMLALLACSAALQLDDETAREAVELVANSNGSTGALMRRVKRLGCVWENWDGHWHLSADVRRELVERLYQELPDHTIDKLHEHLAQKADLRAAQTEPTDQVTSHQKIFASLEAAYHRLLIPRQSEQGANDLVTLWRQLSPQAAEALARSVDYIAGDLIHRLRRLPDQVLFLRGIAAQSGGDNHAQEKYFIKVWRGARHRKPGYVHAKAAHLLALLVQNRDLRAAEKALRDSLKWAEAGRERGFVYLSLGKLIENYPARLVEAQIAYEQSLESFKDPKDQAQAYQALADLHEKKNGDRSRTSSRQDLDQPVEVPEPLATDVQIPIEEFSAPIETEMYQFAETYLDDRGFGRTSETAALVNELYAKFFEPQEHVWVDRAQFFSSMAHVIRRVLLEHAQNFPTLSLASSGGMNQGESFGTRLKDDFLDLDEALNRLQKIDPDQARLVELRFYAGLSVEKTAAVMRIPETDAWRDWRIAKAFLKREIRRAKTVRKALNLPSLMISSKTLSVELR